MARKKKAKIAMAENTTNEDINVLENTIDDITEDSTTTNDEGTNDTDTSNENISTIDNTEEDNTFDGVLLSDEETSIGEKTYIQSLKVNDIDMLKFNGQECERMYIDGEEVWASGITTEVEGVPVTLYEPLPNKRIQQCLIYGNRGDNIIPYPYTNTTKTEYGITFTDNKDGTITVNGTATANALFKLQAFTKDEISKDKQYCMSSSLTSPNAKYYVYMELRKNSKYVAEMGTYANNFKIIDLSSYDYDSVHLYILVAEGATVDNVTFKPQLEEGTTVSDFKTYKSVGDLGTKNLIPYPYYNTTKTVNGITFTDNGDGSITANGTATADAYFSFSGRLDTFEKKKYMLSGCPTGGSKTTYQLNAVSQKLNDDGTYTNLIGAYDYGLNAALDLTDVDFDVVSFSFAIKSGQTVSNIIVKPQFELGEFATVFNINNEKYNIPIITKGKNLILYPYIDEGIKGKTLDRLGMHFIVNEDGTIVVTGTATTTCGLKLCDFYPHRGDIDITKKYMVTAGENIPAQMFLSIVLYDETGTYVSELNTGGTSRVLDLPTLSKGRNIKRIMLRILISKDVGSETPVTFTPQVEEGEISTLYEKYINPSFTMVSLDTPLNPDEYIDVINKKRYNTNGDVIDIQVSNVLKTSLENGTNIIEANTEILPKNIKVIYRKGKTTSVKSGNSITIDDAYRRGKRFISANVYGAANEVKVVPAIKDDSGNETTPAEVQVVGTGRKFINLNNKLNLFKGVDELIEIKADTYYTIQWQAPYNEQYKSIYLYDENKVLTNKIINRAYLSSTYSNMVLKSSTAGFMRLFGDIDKNKGDVQVFVVEGLQGTLNTKQQEQLDSTGIATSMTTCTLGTGDYIYQPYYIYNISIRNSITDTTKTVGDNLLDYTIKYDSVSVNWNFLSFPMTFLKRGRYLLTLENLKDNTTGVSRMSFFPCYKTKTKYSYYPFGVSAFDRVLKIEGADYYWNTNVWALWEGNDKPDATRTMQYVITVKEDLYLHIGLQQTSSECTIEKAELKRIPCIDVDANLNERLHDGEFIDLYNQRRYNKNKQLIEEDVDIVGELTSLPEDDENKIFYNYTDKINKVEVMYYKK